MKNYIILFLGLYFLVSIIFTFDTMRNYNKIEVRDLPKIALAFLILIFLSPILYFIPSEKKKNIKKKKSTDKNKKK